MASKRYKNQIELLQGTLDLLILEQLRWGPSHGYGLSQAIRLHSGDVLHVDAGSMYPALHRLERQGLIRGQWAVSDKKQRTRAYRLTPRGGVISRRADEVGADVAGHCWRAQPCAVE